MDINFSLDVLQTCSPKAPPAFIRFVYGTSQAPAAGEASDVNK